MKDRVCVGVIVGAHGVRGALRVKSFTVQPADLAAYGPVEDESGKRQFPLTLLGESNKGVVLVKLDGVNDRNAADALKGVKLMVPRAALPETEEEEFYYSDLIGLKVELSDGALVGKVKAIFDFGGGDVIEIQGPNGAVMYPFTRAVVPVVDIAGGRLVIDPPEEIVARPDGLDGDEDAGDEVEAGVEDGVRDGE